MKIKNQTTYNTRQIQALAFEVCRRELLGPDFTKRLRITVKYSRTQRFGGWAYYHSHYMVLRLPRPGSGGPATLDCVTVAKIIAHELAHCQGVKHAKMKEPRYSWAEGWRAIWAWAADYRIDNVPPARKAKTSKAERTSAKVAQCERACQQWQRKIKLARTWLAKWQRRLKYYRKQQQQIGSATTTTPAEEGLSHE